MNLTHPDVQNKMAAWQDELRIMTGNFRIVIAAHIQPMASSKIDELVTTVCEETGINITLIRTKTRKRDVVIARQLLAYYGRVWCGLSYNELGGLLGGRDHSTAIHSKQTIEDLLTSKNEAVCYYVKRINKRLEERNNPK